MNCSFIIELENLHNSELWRAERMFQQLGKQICENSDKFTSKTEVIIIYNEGEEYDYNIEKLAKDNLKSCLSLIELKLIAAPTNTLYHAAKNFGSKHASNEIIIFLDSDVIPDDGWLSSVLEPLSDPHIVAVGGTPYIAPDNFFYKAFSSFWIFPPKADEDGHTADLAKIVPNNMAIRSEIFSKHNFPVSTGVRGAEFELVQILINNDLQILRLPSARVSHPSPNGFHHAFLRGLAEGHGLMSAWKGSHDHLLTQEQKDNKTLSHYLRKKIGIFNQRLKLMKLTWYEKIGCFFLGTFYFGAVGIGGTITVIKPDYLKESIRT